MKKEFYGVSIIQKAFKELYKMRLLEEALIEYRLTRAPETEEEKRKRTIMICKGLSS